MTNRCKVHKFKRHKGSGNYPVYKCIYCPAYYTEPMVIGVMNTCWICGKEFTMTMKTLFLKPNCGCKNEIKLERISQGAAMDDIKDKILKIRPKTFDEDSAIKHDLINHLMSKLSSK